MTESNETKWTKHAAMLRSLADENRKFAASLDDPNQAAEFDARRNRKSRRVRVDAANARERILQAIEDSLFGEGEPLEEARLLKEISRHRPAKILVYPKAAEFRQQLINQADRIEGLLEKVEAALS